MCQISKEAPRKEDVCSPSRVSKADFDRQVYYCRLIVCATVAVAFVYKQQLDNLISMAYTRHILPSWVFRHDSFEPSLSSFCFFVYLMFWNSIDYYIPGLHQYRIQKSDDNKSWKDRYNTWMQEAAWYLLPWLLVVDPLFPRREAWLQSVAATTPPTSDRLLYDVFLGLFYYDMFFFAGHFLVHKFKFLFDNIHAKHHQFHTIRAGDSIRHTFIDGSLDVFYSVMALKFSGAHFLSRAVYDLTAIWLLSEAHSGMDFPFMLHNIIPFRLMGGSVVHDMHHRSGNKNFSKFFTHFDWVFGTLRWECPRTPSLIVSKSN